MGQIVIVGFPDGAKIPGVYGDTKFGASGIQLGAAPLRLLLVGQKTAAGSMVSDQDIKQCFSSDEADDLVGPGSPLGNMVVAALAQSNGEPNGFELWLCPIADPTGTPASAAATLTVANVAGLGGSIYIFIGRYRIEVNIAANTSAADAAAAIEAAVEAEPRVPVTVGVVGAVATFTWKVPGVVGNDGIIALDLSLAPTTQTYTLGGGTSIDATTRRFGGGTGTPATTNGLAITLPEFYHRVVWQMNDSTSLAAIEAQCDAKAAPGVEMPEHYATAGNGSLAAADSLAQTTLNAHRFQFCWQENAVDHPSETAAAMAAARAMREGSMPNQNYDGLVLKGLRGQVRKADWPTRAEQQSALDNGITPLTSNAAGEVVVIRAVTTRSQDGALPDYRTLDVSEAVVPDAVRLDAGALWLSEYREANKHNAPDPSGGRAAPAGVATPTGWVQRYTQRLRELEEALWITQVTENPMRAEWNTVGKRIMSAIPVVPLPINHQIGVQVLQMSPTL
ncbi:MAG: hypothetical protein HOW73_20575 [Polyangiaceae bacterium]|nr:hypothetical protein [Polyangiaceae bacterium]